VQVRKFDALDSCADCGLYSTIEGRPNPSRATAHHICVFVLCGRLVRFRPAGKSSGIASGPRAAKVAELADAPDLGSGSRKAVGVQVPPFAPDISSPTYSIIVGRLRARRAGWALHAWASQADRAYEGCIHRRQ
jgi:hypothetical protein